MLKKLSQPVPAFSTRQSAGLDWPDTTLRRRQIIERKVFLKKFYNECYLSMAKSLPTDIEGPVLELGSGAGFLKEYIPCLLTSEIIPIPTVDIILDGTRLPFADNTLSGIVMIDVLHHLFNAARFFSDAAACIKPGGLIIMIEPWSTPWSRFVYRHLHHEPFDPDAENWEMPAGGPLSQANSALPWIIFKRDREEFESKFPQFRLQEIFLTFPICYLFSGGFSTKASMPGKFYNTVRNIENMVQPWMNWLAMFAKIILKRKSSACT